MKKQEEVAEDFWVVRCPRCLSNNVKPIKKFLPRYDFKCRNCKTMFKASDCERFMTRF